MKNIALSVLALALTASFSVAETVTVTVKGMVCSFCAQGIIKRFSREPDVKVVKPDLDKKLVIIELKDGATITDERIATVVADAGYESDTIARSE